MKSLWKAGPYLGDMFPGHPDQEDEGDGQEDVSQGEPEGLQAPPTHLPPLLACWENNSSLEGADIC